MKFTGKLGKLIGQGLTSHEHASVPTQEAEVTDDRRQFLQCQLYEMKMWTCGGLFMIPPPEAKDTRVTSDMKIIDLNVSLLLKSVKGNAYMQLIYRKCVRCISVNNKTTPTVISLVLVC